MAKHKYGMQKPVQNDLQQCINSFERMKRGGIGIADELVCDTCKRALKYIDELEAKLSKSEPVRHGHWIPQFVSKRGLSYHFMCSECAESSFASHKIRMIKYNYCPNCGAKMDGDNNV